MCILEKSRKTVELAGFTIFIKISSNKTFYALK